MMWPNNGRRAPTRRFFLALVILVIFCFLTPLCLASIEQIWPLPMTKSSKGSAIRFLSPEFHFAVAANLTQNQIVKAAIERYTKYLFAFGGPAAPPSESRFDALELHVAWLNVTALALGVDESYSINIGNAASGTLNAKTVWGLLRGLETFYQLVDYVPPNSYKIISLPIEIEDAPAYPWRGLLVDTARHYLPMETLKRAVDALSWNKMNTFHWHMTDSQSFPIEIKSRPKLHTHGAWAPDAVYTATDIKELVRYATERGVRVVPEIDLPGHVASWSKGIPGMALVDCPNVKDMIPVDPSSPELYPVLEDVFTEVLPLFNDEYVHIGADEVKWECWTTERIRAYMRNHSLGNHKQLQQFFTDRIGEILHKNNRRKVVAWHEFMDNELHLPDMDDVIIQNWMIPTHLGRSITKGMRTINAAGWYLDQQVPGQPTHYQWAETWINFWKLHLSDLIGGKKSDLLLGGEACNWAEMVDGTVFESRVWPRASGTAERLWSIHPPGSVEDARSRLMAFRCRMVRRGVGAGPIWPDHCLLPQEAKIRFAFVPRPNNVVTSGTSAGGDTVVCPPPPQKETTQAPTVNNNNNAGNVTAPPQNDASLDSSMTVETVPLRCPRENLQPVAPGVVTPVLTFALGVLLGALRSNSQWKAIALGGILITVLGLVASIQMGYM